ncbi:conserved hypothetical protein [Ricinus communis]|uniref:DUF4283 domain-containing protein n=1 Tax=Ricinus communis TaxID=3988 RepID=B9S3K6_RICCO|nr:conserved hypothetical protein [Ricinus communis]
MEDQLASLALSTEEEEDEDLVLEIDQNEVRESRFILCSVTDQSINFNTMRNHLSSLWSPGRGICIKEIAVNLYLFQFFYILDSKRVIDGGPWSFDNHLLVYDQLLLGEILAQMKLNFLDMWVHVYELPVGFMSVMVSKQLNKFVEEFLDYVVNNNTSVWRSYMRIRI